MNGGFGGIRAVEILGIAGDDYYVLYDDEYYEETAVLDGHPQSYMADHYKYALISRQDYLANIPNYRTVTEVE